MPHLSMSVCSAGLHKRVVTGFGRQGASGRHPCPSLKLFDNFKGRLPPSRHDNEKPPKPLQNRQHKLPKPFSMPRNASLPTEATTLTPRQAGPFPPTALAIGILRVLDSFWETHGVKVVEKTSKTCKCFCGFRFCGGSSEHRYTTKSTLPPVLPRT